MKRTAQCSCGQLRVIATSEPTSVSLCHCNACKRRTGSSFGVAVFFDQAEVQLTGASSVFERPGESGHRIRFHFCPHCGSTVYWYPQVKPKHIAVALGCIDDQTGLKPSKEAHVEQRQAWLDPIR